MFILIGIHAQKNTNPLILLSKSVNLIIHNFDNIAPGVKYGRIKENHPTGAGLS